MQARAEAGLLNDTRREEATTAEKPAREAKKPKVKSAAAR
jgi:hypothetical protein